MIFPESCGSALPHDHCVLHSLVAQVADAIACVSSRLVTTADGNTTVQAERERVKDWREADEKLSDTWQEKVQDYYEFIIDYTKQLERRTADPAAQFPLAEKFRLENLSEDTFKKVEEARRYLLLSFQAAGRLHTSVSVTSQVSRCYE